jgi:hypothetical protein
MILVAYFSVISWRYALFLVTGQMPQLVVKQKQDGWPLVHCSIALA